MSRSFRVWRASWAPGLGPLMVESGDLLRQRQAARCIVGRLLLRFTGMGCQPHCRGAPIVTPVVSVVLPTHNGRRYIRQSIDSVLAQTLNDFELIVVDDASTDDTADIVNEYSDPRLRLVRLTRNAKLPGALNIRLSRDPPRPSHLDLRRQLVRAGCSGEVTRTAESRSRSGHGLCACLSGGRCRPGRGRSSCPPDVGLR